MAVVKQIDQQMAALFKSQPDAGKDMLNAAIVDRDMEAVDRTIRQIEIAQGVEVTPYLSSYELRNMTLTSVQNRLDRIGATLEVRDFTDEELSKKERIAKETEEKEAEGGPESEGGDAE